MSKVIKPKRGYKKNIINALSTAQANEMLVAIDTQEVFIANGDGSAAKMTDVIFVNKSSDLETINGVANKIYICYEECKIYAYDGLEFKKIFSHNAPLPAEYIIETPERRFVSDEEKEYWNSKPSINLSEEESSSKQLGDIWVVQTNF